MTKLTFYITSWFYHIRTQYKEFRDWQSKQGEMLELQIKKSLALNDEAKRLNKWSDELTGRLRNINERENQLVRDIEIQSKDVIRLIRHNLSGDPLNTEVPESPEKDEGYYGEVNSLSKNKTLLNEINQLKKEFLENIAYQVNDIEWLNFNRARIDGLTILTERLEQKGAEKESYDRGREKENGGTTETGGRPDQSSSRQG